MQASIGLGYVPSLVFFTWSGFDEMDEVTGDASIEITFAYHNGHEAILRAKEPFSTDC